MIHYAAPELAASFRTVRANTMQIAQEIDEQHYGFQPAPGARTVAQTLYHISVASNLQERIHGEDRVHTLVGFNFMAFFGPIMAGEQSAHTKAELLDMLSAQETRYATWLETLTPEILNERVAMPEGVTPASKTRFEMILGVKEHEMTHRAQLMLAQRILGHTPHLTRAMQARMAEMAAAAAKA